MRRPRFSHRLRGVAVELVHLLGYACDMTIRANVHEAKTHFSELLERAHKGEEVIIAKAGKPYARLVPLVEGKERAPGAFRGQISGDVLGAVGADDSGWG